MKKNTLLLSILSFVVLLTACKKKLDDKNLWKAVIAPASPISDGGLFNRLY